MTRRLLTLGSVLSLLGCVGLCVLWVRSYRTPANGVAGRDHFNMTRSDPRYWLISGPGRLTLCRQEGRNWDNPLDEHALLGVRFGGLWGGDGSLLWNLDVPYWLLAAATALPAPLALRRYLRRRRARSAARGGCASAAATTCAKAPNAARNVAATPASRHRRPRHDGRGRVPPVHAPG